ncbi:MAG TPA: gephyrin-like molybdotransferase Glp [Anaeromyxobacter sp.]|nr:gephyrin-like molybdotransferase Glp [Anaeromyxobacter sp.]
MLSPETALARILAAVSRQEAPATEPVALREASWRTLAEDLLTPEDVPPFAVATMDGYALRAADARAPGARLPVAFEVFAGSASARSLPRGGCCRIFTGAVLPEGADAVEQQEVVRRQGRAARFGRAVPAGQFVRPRGSDLRAGEIALPAGTVLDPPAVALAAKLGRVVLRVRRRPRAVILPTGDELVPPGRTPRPGQIRESNGLALAAAVREAGGEARVLPPVRDRAGSLERALRAVRGADLLLTVGGVSVGERDLVRGALARAGARLHFWRVAIRPGKPFTFGVWDRMPVFGLPGNPASALVTFEVFVRPALRALQGLAGDGRLHAWVRLDRDHEKPRDLTVFVRARLGPRPRGPGLPWAEPLRTQKSGDLSSLLGADALVVLPAGKARFRRGQAAVARVLRAPARGGLPHDP